MEGMHTQQPPSLMFKIAHALILNQVKKAIGFDQTDLFYFGAAPLKKTTLMHLASLDIPVFNVYGMSESSTIATMNTRANLKLHTSGQAIPGCEVKIENPDENGEGEVLMRGRNIMMGYLKNE